MKLAKNAHKVQPVTDSQGYTPTAIPQQNYYFAKYPDMKPLENPSQYVILDMNAWNIQVEHIQMWLEQHQQPCVLSKDGTLIPYEEVTTDKLVTKSGWDVIIDGQGMTEFEWSNQVRQNYISALSRQMSGRVVYDPQHVQQFALRCLDYIGFVTNHMLNQPED
jgi:hypothetical protein